MPQRRRIASAPRSRERSPASSEAFAAGGGAAARACRSASIVVARLRRDRGAARRRRRHPAGLSRRQAAGRRARLRRPDRQDAQPPVARRRRRLGALQARPAHRAHPGRRGAGYEPRPMGGGAGDRRGFLLPARARRARRARSSPSATTSSRSSASRAPRRDMLAEMQRFFEREVAEAEAGLRRAAAVPLLPLDARGAGRGRHGVRHGARAARSPRRATRRMRRIATTSPAMSCSCRAIVRQKVEEPEDWTDALRRAERGGDGARASRSPTRSLRLPEHDAALRQAPPRRRDPDPGAPARRFRRRHEPRAARAADPDRRRRPHPGRHPHRGARSAGARRRDAAAGGRPAARRAA